MNEQDLELTNKMLSNLETLLDAEATITKRDGKYTVQIRLQNEAIKKDVYMTITSDRIGFCLEWFTGQVANHLDLEQGRWIHRAQDAVVEVVIENVAKLN
jgi:hypothetical protein